MELSGQPTEHQEPTRAGQIAAAEMQRVAREVFDRMTGSAASHYFHCAEGPQILGHNQGGGAFYPNGLLRG